MIFYITLNSIAASVFYQKLATSGVIIQILLPIVVAFPGIVHPHNIVYGIAL